MGFGRHDNKIDLKSHDGQALIAAGILSNPDSERELAGLRREVLRGLKLLDRDGALGALESFALAVKGFDFGGGASIARLASLGLRLMEYAAEHGMDVRENICGIIAGQSDMDSAHECLKRYLAELIDERGRLADKQNRHGALAAEYIKEHYAQTDLSVKHMTSLLSVSSSYFSAMFKNYTGATFVEFLTGLRVGKAKELLLATDKKNYEVATAVGYDDPGYFRQIFKRHTGSSPSEFRKKARKKGNSL